MFLVYKVYRKKGRISIDYSNSCELNKYECQQGVSADPKTISALTAGREKEIIEMR